MAELILALGSILDIEPASQNLNHRNLHALFSRRLNSLVISRICMTRYANTWIVRQHSIQSLCRFIRSIGYGNLSGVERVANTDATSMMK
jgi:hypothetical protein